MSEMSQNEKDIAEKIFHIMTKSTNESPPTKEDMNYLINNATPGVLNDAVCELAIGMMFGLMRRIPEAHEFVKSKAWSKGLFAITTTLAGKKVGILGMGRNRLRIAGRRSRGKFWKLIFLYV